MSIRSQMIKGIFKPYLFSIRILPMALQIMPFTDSARNNPVDALIFNKQNLHFPFFKFKFSSCNYTVQNKVGVAFSLQILHIVLHTTH
jgi:hypothetical protein